MDRHAKKLEKRRKEREQAKKKAQALAARKPSAQELLMRSAARNEFGPCFVSAGWDNAKTPALVSLLVTRELPSGDLVPALLLVDRTCLGIKNAFTPGPMSRRDLDDFVEVAGRPHGGMVSCEPLIAQSIVFHAIEYARSLSFEPHSDFPAALLGARPPTLLSTPWCAPERPIYISGPHDDTSWITSRLIAAVGAAGFEHIDPFALADDEEEEEEEEEEDDGFGDELAEPLVHSPLERSISAEGVRLQIFIYRGVQDTEWHLEVEDHLGGSTVWNEQFATDQEALDAALQAIETDGIASFVPPAESSL